MEPRLPDVRRPGGQLPVTEQGELAFLLHGLRSELGGDPGRFHPGDFTISPEIREISYHHPESLSIEDYHLKYHFNRSATIPSGPRFIDAVPSLVKGLSWVGPGQKKRFEMDTAGAASH